MLLRLFGIKVSYLFKISVMFKKKWENLALLEGFTMLKQIFSVLLISQARFLTFFANMAILHVHSYTIACILGAVYMGGEQAL